MLGEDVLALVLLVMSPVVCFTGARLWKPTVGAVGFSFFGYLVYLFFWWLCDHGHCVHEAIRLVAIIVIGVIGGLLALAVYELGVCLAGATAMGLLANAALTGIGEYSGVYISVDIRILVVLIAAAIGAVLAHYFMQTLARILTAFVGAYMFVGGLSYWLHRLHAYHVDPLSPGVFLRHREDPHEHHQGLHCRSAYCVTLFGLWAVLFLVGLAVQMRRNRDDEDRKFDRTERRVYYHTDSHAQLISSDGRRSPHQDYRTMDHPIVVW